MRLRARWLPVVLAMAAMPFIASCGGGDSEDEGEKKGGAGVALDEVRQFAPPDAVGMGVANIAGIREAFLSAVEAEGQEERELVDALGQLAGKVDWLAVYLTRPFFGSGLLVVLHGDATPGDLVALLERLGPASVKLAKGDNGRYEGEGRGAPRIIYGAEADDVAEGILLVGDKMVLTDGLVARLGTGKEGALDEMLKSADTSAPAWLVMQGFPHGEAKEPAAVPNGKNGPAATRAPRQEPMLKSVVAAVHPLGDAASTVELIFPDAKMAGQFLPEVQREIGRIEPLKGLIEAEQADATVRITVAADKSLPSRLVKLLTGGRRSGRATASMSNLHNIGVAVMHYSETYRLKLPRSLAQLKPYIASTSVFVSPASGRKPPKIEGGKIVGETDYVYILDAVPPKDPQSDRTIGIDTMRMPPTFVLAYERPENYQGRGTNVLFADCHVEFLPAKEFRQQLDRTKEELRKMGW